MLGLELFWEAFWELTTCRSVGFSMGPIPWLAMREYAVTFEMGGDQQDDLFYLVREMDNAYINHHKPPEATKSPLPASSPKKWGS